MNLIAITDQLSAAARDNVPPMIDAARAVHSTNITRDQKLAVITAHLTKVPAAGLAALAADVMLRLVESEETR